MSGFSLPVNRPTGRAIVVASAAGRGQPVGLLTELGYQVHEAGDPYEAMAELCRRPMVYRALVLSLGGLYREELQIIAVVKRRFPHVEIWLTQTDTRAAALAEALRLGADGMLSADGLHRFAAPDKSPEAAAALPAPTPLAPPPAPTLLARTAPPPVIERPSAAAAPERREPANGKDHGYADTLPSDPVLTADELRALLDEQPVRPLLGQDERE